MRAALLCVLLLALPTGAQEAVVPIADVPLPNRVDYTHPRARDLPIRCHDGDVEYFAGKTLGEVFGDQWPDAPAATRATPARQVERTALSWPNGLGQTGARSMVAVLVGPDGKAIQARALCASTPAISKPAVRASMRSRYAPATYDGVPATGVFISTIRFGVLDAPESPVPERPAAAGRP
ncbi:energy transducer TonB [Lysobacter humi (ex Lee et al. 2017)]